MLPTDNPFAVPSELPLQFPPFDRIREEHYRPAIEQGMAEHLAEVEAIGADPAPPSFANTLEALERSGRLLDRVLSVFYNLVSSDSTDSLLAIEGEVSPMLAAHEDAIHLDPALFARIDELHRRRAELGLEPEQLRLLERRHTDFVRAGAGLAEPDQQRLRSLNERLSTLTSTFSTRLLAETRDLAVHVQDRAELDGLAEDAVAAAEQAARTRGLASGYLLTLVLPTAQPALASLTHRGLRQRLHEASVSRGLRGNEHDTRAVITEIAALRAERAALLGFADHASYVVADRTAGTVEAVTSMLGALVGPAVENARAEAVELEAALHADGHEGPLQAWDWAFYAERVKAARFEVDEARLRPYFELHRVLHDGVFHAATALYGITFAERHDLPVYHPDVTVFDVNDEDGSLLGLFICDWFARDSKRGGAWMSTFVDQARLLGTRPVVVVNLNVPRPPGGRAGADDQRQRAHGVPRVRPRPARPVLRRDLPPAVRHERAARLRRVPLPGQRDVGLVAAGPRQLRPAPRDRRAAAAVRGRGAARGQQLRRGVRDGGVPRRRPARPRVAPPGPGSAARWRWRTSRSSSARRCTGTASTWTSCPRATAAPTSSTRS